MGVILDVGWGRQPLVQFEVAEGWIGKLFPHIEKVNVDRAHVEILGH